MLCRVDLTLRGCFACGRALLAGSVESLFHLWKIVVREPVELHEIVAGLAIESTMHAPTNSPGAGFITISLRWETADANRVRPNRSFDWDNLHRYYLPQRGLVQSGFRVSMFD
jgi:hypothetical protein